MSRRIFTVAMCAAAAGSISLGQSPAAIDPARLPRIGTVSERFQSFNVEMVEVTGGRFWAPYKASASGPEKAPTPGLSAPAIDPAAFRTRQPIDLGNARLRKLAAALGPAYVRVSGTWANSTWFQDSDRAAPATPQPGFGGVLTRSQWKGVIDFSRATNARIVTSFAISDGVRDDSGKWTPRQAASLFAFTKASGGTIAAAEFFNEPSIAAMGGAPKGYDAAAYGRDFKTFRDFARKTAPDMLILGPGSLGEVWPAGELQMLKTEDMMTATGPGVDAFSYHFYGGVSKRCGFMKGAPVTSVEDALSEGWLARTDRDEAFYSDLRDRFEPGKPLWLTETAETACGGNPWASSFIDSFRYLDQLGRLAKRGVQVVAHNTLAASDYGLIDEETLIPRPDYWSALLWHRLMGTTVLDAGVSSPAELHVYAQCEAGHAGGVTLLAINTDRSASHEISVPAKSERYTMTATDLLGSTVDLNGKPLKMGQGDEMPALKGMATKAGAVTLAPASITFLAIPNAGNTACR